MSKQEIKQRLIELYYHYYNSQGNNDQCSKILNRIKRLEMALSASNN